MSKTSIATLLTRIKRKADYNITDPDLDIFIVDEINNALKVVKQWLMDYGFFKEVGKQDSFPTVASQNYVDISTETIDFDEQIALYEKTNDQIIDIISYDEFVALYPDSSACTSTTPDHAAFFANKLFLGPTPNSIITIYLDYIFNITEVTSGSDCPFNNKYDPLIEALGVKGVVDFLEPANTERIASVNRNVEFYGKQLIFSASKNIGMQKGTASRKPEVPHFSPRKVIN